MGNMQKSATLESNVDNNCCKFLVELWSFRLQTLHCHSTPYSSRSYRQTRVDKKNLVVYSTKAVMARL